MFMILLSLHLLCLNYTVVQSGYHLKTQLLYSTTALRPHILFKDTFYRMKLLNKYSNSLFTRFKSVILPL